MTTTVLIDLDDTLLHNQDERFIPMYLERLSQHFSSLKPADRLKDALLRATRAMQSNRDPERLLIELFENSFYPALDLKEPDVRPLLETFLQVEYPKLRELTERDPAAEVVIGHLQDEGVEIAIATNPLYPSQAIRQRLDWAEVPAEGDRYRLITSYENSRFTKPHMEYYAEILGKLGRRPQEAVMIGDSLENDIAPAAEMGISVFHITKNGAANIPSGDLASVLSWMEDSTQPDDPLESASPRNLIARLRGNLAAFHDLAYRYPSNRWDLRPNPDSWAAVEILAHLRDVECEINHPRFDAILKKDEPFLSAVESDKWAEEREYLQENPPLALDGLRQARKRTISALEDINTDAWRRPARHALFGRTTLLELVLITLDHDLTHIRQLRDVFQEV